MHIDPVKALFWAAILNGVVAAPLMAVIHGYGLQQESDGSIRHPSSPESDGMACYGGHDVRLHWRLCDLEVNCSRQR
jgi:hypothetical protein